MWIPIGANVDWGGLGKKMNMVLNVLWGRQLSWFCKNIRITG